MMYINVYIQIQTNAKLEPNLKQTAIAANSNSYYCYNNNYYHYYYYYY